MKKLFINLSNHPSVKWSEEQRDAALELGQGGEIVDMAFPNVPPEEGNHWLWDCANFLHGSIVDTMREHDAQYAVVHVMGEQGLTYAVLQCLEGMSYLHCVHSTTVRNVTTLPDGTQQTVFRFVQFRRY